MTSVSAMTPPASITWVLPERRPGCGVVEGGDGPHAGAGGQVRQQHRGGAPSRWPPPPRPRRSPPSSRTTPCAVDRPHRAPQPHGLARAGGSPAGPGPRPCPAPARRWCRARRTARSGGRPCWRSPAPVPAAPRPGTAVSGRSTITGDMPQWRSSSRTVRSVARTQHRGGKGRVSRAVRAARTALSTGVPRSAVRPVRACRRMLPRQHDPFPAAAGAEDQHAGVEGRSRSAPTSSTRRHLGIAGVEHLEAAIEPEAATTSVRILPPHPVGGPPAR